MRQSAESIRSVGVVGGGLIGLSWAALFAARGLEAVVYDPEPAVEDELAAFVATAWPTLREIGLAEAETPSIAPRFTTALAGLASVDFVQENVPDRIEIKRQTVALLEEVIGENVVIASSTSSLLASDIQAEAKHPSRILVGHPMNPPHLVPLVELVAGEATSPEAMDLAEAFYRRLDRITVRVKKEAVGHIANRLSSALYREAVHMVAEGIASVGDIDKTIAYGPGLRWALIGPHLMYHLGGGKGGLRHCLEHLGPTQEVRWRELGTPSLTQEVKDLLLAGVAEELQEQDAETLAARRDAALVELLDIKRKHGF